MRARSATRIALKRIALKREILTRGQYCLLKMKSILTLLFIIGIVAAFFFSSIAGGIYREYGGHNLRLAVKEYVEVNKVMPKSWQDIEEYHSDPLFGVKSTKRVRRYWNVAWGIDIKENIKYSSTQKNTFPSIIYRNNSGIDPTKVLHWDIGDEIREISFD